MKKKSAALASALLLCKKQFIILGRHLDFVARLELAFEQFHGQRIRRLLPPSLNYGETGLHGAFERTRAVIGHPAR